MREFLVGLLVLFLTGIFSVVGVLLFPLLLLLGIFLRLVLGVIFLLLVIWLVGKATLFLIDYVRNRNIAP